MSLGPRAWNSLCNGEHITNQLANSAITGSPVLIAAGNRDYRSPEMSGSAGHRENGD